MNTQTHNQMEHAVTRGAAPERRGVLAGLLTRLSGTAGAWRQRRRGSFLVMVVGTLALLSVFAILYVSIGNQDLRGKAALTRREALDDVPQQFARYIARDIVARDVLSRWYPEAEASAGNPSIPIGWREATDYPSVDWARRSNGLTQGTFFDPVGTMDLPAEFLTAFPGNYPSRWDPTDPWLASGEPTWLNFAGAALPTNLPEYMMKVDWAQISNVAPDGRFVNLYNLRNNFEALPGVGNDPSGRPRLSTGLSLFGPTGLMLPTPVTDFGLSVAANPAKQTPAYWTARQQGAFRPVTMTGDFGPDSPLWPQYQWADADGDGMLDSRLFEMTEWREAPAGQPGHDVRQLLDTDGNIRYFFATRIIDLSALVNVNTAADFRASPNLANPAGISQADIDLRRLLTLRDRVDLDTYLPGAVLSAYDGLPQGASGENYSGYTPAQAHESARHGYTALRLALESRTTPPMFSAATPVARYTAPNGGLESAYITDYGITPPTFLADFTADPGRRLLSLRRYEASLLGTHIDTTFPSGTIQLSGGFGVADTAELLTFRATNNPEFASPLERTLGGRDDSGDVPPPGAPNPATPGTLAYSPLRDNRSTAVDGWRNFNAPAFKRATLLHFAADVRQRLTGVSGARDLRTMRGVDRDVLSASELKSNISVAMPTGQILFNGYVAGLAPYITPGWWNLASGNGAEHLTEFYGYRGPELAVLTAAFMTANAVDMRDGGHTPTSYTVPLDQSFPDANPSAPGNGGIEEADGALAEDLQLFPAAHAGRTLNVGTTRLANAAGGIDTPTAPAVNVFGIEAQPFITQVTTFSVFCDAPVSAGGDSESPGNPITIRGRILAANPDFLYRVIAFQVTNPFSTAITLSTDMFPQARYHNALGPTFPAIDREDGFYYLEFGGKYFKAAALEEQVYVDSATALANRNMTPPLPALGDDSRVGQYTQGLEAVTIAPITIPAGKSVTLYALSQTPRHILSDRLVKVDSNLMGSPQQNLRATIRAAIENNLDADADIAGAYWIPEFNPATGLMTLPVTTAIRDPYPASGSTVNLYRAVRLGDVAQPGEGRKANVNVSGVLWDGVTPAQQTTHELYAEANKVANDRLVDRFRVPAGLNRTLSPTNQQINGTDAGDSKWDNVATILVWANARRPRDGGIAGLTPSIPAGAFPAYCLEPKYASGWNILSTDTVNPNSLNAGDFTGSSYQPGASQSPRNWRLEISSTLLDNLTAPNAPQNITTGPKVGDAPRNNPLIRGTDDYASRYAEVVLINGQTSGPNALAGPMRLGDMLLPLGIGPCEKPLTIAGTVEANPYARWTTLGEAMATALGYENYAGMPAGEVMANFTPQADPLDPGFFLSPLDRGNLWLDRFVPFYDADANGVFDPASGDLRRGLEIPPAMAVLDAFTAAGPVGQGLNYGRQGVININTTPLIVARTLPMLSPPPDLDPNATDPWWWWPTTSPIRGVDGTSDIAATVIAYRDKVDTFARPQSSTFGATPPVDQITFADQPAGTPPNSPIDQLNGRATWSEIPGLSELPGYRTVGELLAARFRNGATAPPAYANNIDHLGYDAKGTTANQIGNNSRIGVSPVLADHGTGAPSADRLSNEYKELLTVFNGVAGSVTTRSDVFACWFVVQGYKKSDVENVKATEPIVPSVQRRFLMILDRSKVTKRGDSAEILYMKEVPMSP
ncbi:MAG: hypothetical protein HBSAPP03_29190 [Phycisphaerae bacterium]|nr:MAG: hypothetical protein HBSAPP03_29190 [Phycisphaerae bacterium]